MRERLWPRRSCKSLAKRSLSSLTARRASSSRADLSSATAAIWRTKPVAHNPIAAVGSASQAMPETVPSANVMAASPAMATYASLVKRIIPAAMLVWKKSTRHSLPRTRLSEIASTARDAIIARRLRTSRGPADGDQSGACVHISHRKTPAKSVAPLRARKTRVTVGSDVSTARIG
jgi:hypothetical protein